MRRSFVLCASLIPAAVFLAGCEDGPNDTYAPAGANAGNVWNNGDTPAAVDDAGTSFGANYGGTSKTEICSGAELQDQWSRMVEQPVQPPYKVAGVDLSGINWSFLTVEQATNGVNGMLMPVMGAKNPPTRLCQGQNLGSGANGGDIGGSLVTAWGNNSEFYMEWAINTHKAYFTQILPGYNGSMDWTFKTDPAACPQDPTYVTDGNMHTYHFQLGKPLQKDGKDFTLDWNGYASPGARFACEDDELYRGLSSAYVPDLYDDLPQGVHCKDTGRCLILATGNDQVHPLIGFRTISMYFELGPPSQPQPSGSTPRDAYFFNIKYAPYSPAVSFLKMDAVGPTGSLNPIGSKKLDCELALGKTFGDLTGNCIQVFTDTATNQTAMAKVLGNITHDDQNFTFSVVGINQNYRPAGLDLGGAKQFTIISDTDTPQQDAVAVDFTLDVRANGAILNDRYPKTDAMGNAVPGVYSRDNHGAGVIYREWGRMVQKEMAAKWVAIHGGTPKTLHDPSCLVPMACQGDPSCAGLSFGACGANPLCGWGYNFAPGQDITTWRAAPGCTGFEGQITEAYNNTSALDGSPLATPATTDPDSLQFDNPIFGAYNYSDSGLRPGTPYANFCLDPGIYNFCGSPSIYGQSNGLIDAALPQVITIMGNGDINNLPPGVGDRRYFFSTWAEAWGKYMESGAATHLGQNNCTIAAGPSPNACTPAPDPIPYFGDYALDTDNFFFDSYGGGANRGEFISFLNADMTHDPIGLNLSVLLYGTNLQEIHFYRRLDREERALFNAMGNQDAKAAGQASWGVLKDGSGNVVKDEWGQPRKNADMFITNIAGSPAISGMGYGPVTCAMDSDCPAAAVGISEAKCRADGICVVDSTKIDSCFPTLPQGMTAEYCATHLNPNCGLQAPQDSNGVVLTRPNGEPILSGYCGVFNGTPFAIGTSNIKLINDDYTAVQQQLTTTAEVSMPVYANPYDMTSALGPPIKVLVPWQPEQNGVGFPVATTGQQDIFVQTAELDFSGQVVVPVMDYLPVTVTPTAPDGGPGGASYTAANVMAYESQDFLGETFLCYDTVTAANRAGSGRPGDILSAHMYTSAQDILTWIGSHPTAQDNCTLIVRYSPFNNYPDYISSIGNGVRVGIDQGSGAGRVTDLTLFQPGLGAPAPP